MHRCRIAAVLLILVLTGFCRTAPDQGRTQEDEETLRTAGLSMDPASLLDYFRKRTLTGTGQKSLQSLIQQLGDSNFRVREKASTGLVSMGMSAVPFLREAKKSQDIEVARRAEECLRAIEERDSRVGIPVAAARLIALRKPAGATEVLLGFLPYAENETVAEEVQNSLAALAMREGKPDAAIVAGLKSEEPVARGACAIALGKSGKAEQRTLVRPLLQDKDLTVRLQAAIALASRDKEAIQVLVELLEKLPANKAWKSEELLVRLAGDKAPTESLGKDEASRRRCREAWAAWWKENESKVDLTRLERESRLLGYTLLVMLDAGQIVELGTDNKPRFHLEGLLFPLDAQVVDDDRILVAEHKADRVTERNRRGEIVWQKAVPQPLVAQRLANGNTFIATESGLFEVDRKGNEVFSYSRQNGEQIMKAIKRPNGDIFVVSSSRRLYRLDASGKELFSFPAQVQTSGGRLEVLPNGHILLAEVNNNRIVEFDATGQIVWQARFPRPLAAIRLPNGHTLVTAYQDTRAVEIDRNGKEVWEYKSDLRITRAFRR